MAERIIQAPHPQDQIQKVGAEFSNLYSKLLQIQIKKISIMHFIIAFFSCCFYIYIRQFKDSKNVLSKIKSIDYIKSYHL